MKAVMSGYNEAKIKDKVESGLSEELPENVGVHQGSVLSPGP